jgi:hypothetical protein
MQNREAERTLQVTPMTGRGSLGKSGMGQVQAIADPQLPAFNMTLGYIGLEVKRDEYEHGNMRELYPPAPTFEPDVRSSPHPALARLPRGSV